SFMTDPPGRYVTQGGSKSLGRIPGAAQSSAATGTPPRASAGPGGHATAVTAGPGGRAPHFGSPHGGGTGRRDAGPWRAGQGGVGGGHESPQPGTDVLMALVVLALLAAVVAATNGWWVRWA